LTFLDFASTYFTSQPILVTLTMLYSSLALLFVLFKFEKYRPQRRLQILFVSFAVVILTWGFIASSLLLCDAFIGLYQAAEGTAVRTVFSLALLASLLVALPLSALVTYKVPGVITRRLVKELPEPGGAVVDAARKLALGSRISALAILQSPSGLPFAYSVGGAESVIVVSKGLVAQLNEDEVQTVLAHELAHVKNHDTGLNTIVAVYRKVLFFDPFIRLLERTIHSEKEFSADEISARETHKPLSLASALLKISSAHPSRWGPPKIEGHSILGSGEILRPPGVKERIERLMRLATELEREADVTVGAGSGSNAASDAS
jgi:Zn-dependent protease with chaperone function